MEPHVSAKLPRDGDRTRLYLLVAVMGYGAILMVIGFWRRSAFVRWQGLLLIAATIVKVFVYDVSQLDRGYRILSFIGLGILLLAISFAYQRDWLQLGSGKRAGGESADA